MILNRFPVSVPNVVKITEYLVLKLDGPWMEACVYLASW